MKSFDPGYLALETSDAKRPKFVVQLSWDADDTDFTYLTSGPSVALPDNVDFVHGAVIKIGGQSQKINPDVATSTIGSITVDLLDVTQNQNLLTYSQDFENAAWTKVRCTVDSNTVTAPDGTLTGDTLVCDGNADPQCRYFFDTGVALAGRTFAFTLWAWVDAGEQTSAQLFLYDDNLEEIGSLSINDLSTTPKRYTLKHAFSAAEIGSIVTGRFDPTNAPVNGTKVHIWGSQLNELNSLDAAVPEYTRTIDFPVIETGAAISQKISDKLKAGDGLRDKKVRVYVGYKQMPFSDYDLRLTYIVDSISYKDGKYALKISDVQRAVRHKIFTPHKTHLSSGISATDLIIPVTDIDAALFPAVDHDSASSVLPGESFSYIKLDKEVIRHQGGIAFDATNGFHLIAIDRGALNTTAVEHSVSDNTETERKPEIVEHIYIEAASPKAIYALYTGKMQNVSGVTTLPDHWHLGIDESLVRLGDFENLGRDMWDTENDLGRKIRIENPGTQDGKRYIEKEILLWMGCFAPVYSTGEIGIKRLSGILSDAPWLTELNKFNIVSYSDLKHDMRKVINHITIDWNWVDSKEKFTKQSVLIDADSITKHGSADEKNYKFKAVQVGVHSDEDLRGYFDVVRDRYSGPPLILSMKVLPSMSRIEVGDTVKVTLEQIRDMNTGASIDRTFEVQQVQSNWVDGSINLHLLGSSQKAGTLVRTSLSTVLLDSYYTQAGTDLSTDDLNIVNGVVIENGALVGSGSNIDDSAAIFYYEGDLEIPDGVTVTLKENVQLRVKGHLTVNGIIDGIGGGGPGGASAGFFENGTKTTTFAQGAAGKPSPVDYGYGVQAYFGLPKASLNFKSTSFILGDAISANPYLLLERFDQQFAISPLTFDWVNWLPHKVHTDIGHINLVNDQQTNTLRGYPKDIMGNPGASGTPYIAQHLTSQNVVNEIKADSGSGGRGGSGLMITCRGMSFGGNGNINLSGGNSSVGAPYVHESGKKIYGGCGAPGAPGALLVYFDGQHTNPDILKGRFIAKYGDQVVPAGITEVTQDILTAADNRLLSIEGDVVGSFGMTENTDHYQSAHRFQYIPVDVTPVDAAGDDSLFDDIGSSIFNLITELEDPIPVSFGEFGTSIGMTNNGSRCVVMCNRGQSGTDPEILIFRNVFKPVLEQRITITGADTSSGPGLSALINEEGNRIIFSHPQYSGSNVREGRVYVYSRQSETWSLEQTITPNGAALNYRMGHAVSSSAGLDKLLMITDSFSQPISRVIEYWSRSGTNWSYKQTLSNPSGAEITSLRFEVSGDGNWMVCSSPFATVDGLLKTGEIYVYERDVVTDTWNHVKTLVPYTVGAPNAVTGDTRFGSVEINYDGSAIIVSGNRTRGDSSQDVGSICVYNRIGVRYDLIQVIDGDATSSEIGSHLVISDDGLTLAATDYQDEKTRIYQRVHVSQSFIVKQLIEHVDAGPYSNLDKPYLSRDGKILSIANSESPKSQSDAGISYIWKRFDS